MPPENRPPDGDPWPSEETAADSAIGPRFERPWMAAFIEEALRTADVPAALKNHAVGWGDYSRFRRSCPAFALACQELDLVVKQSLWTILESKAATGDARSLKLLAGGLESIKAQLESAGQLDTPAAIDPFDDIPFVRFGRYALPAGPCAACATGLLVRDDHKSTGQSHYVLIKHGYMSRPSEPAEFVDIQPYDNFEEWRHERGIPVVYGFPIGEPTGQSAEPALHVMEHVNDWGIDPKYCLPPHTGPNREEIREIWARQRAARSVPSGPEWFGKDEPDPDDPSFLPLDFPKGDTPPAAIRQYYQTDVAADGIGLVWRMRPEYRGQGLKGSLAPEQEPAAKPKGKGGRHA